MEHSLLGFGQLQIGVQDQPALAQQQLNIILSLSLSSFAVGPDPTGVARDVPKKDSKK